MEDIIIQYIRANRRLREDLGREPIVEEIAAETGIEAKEIERIREEAFIICSNCNGSTLIQGCLFLDLTKNQVLCSSCKKPITESYLEKKMDFMGRDKSLLNSGACFICNEGNSDETLVNGVKYHRECYSELIEAKKKLAEEFLHKKFLIDNLERSLKGYRRILGFLKKTDKDEVQEKIQNTKYAIDSLSYKLELIKLLLKNLYDFWPRRLDYDFKLDEKERSFDCQERKADWEERRARVLDYYEHECILDGEHYGSLHIHHKRRFDEGGNHKIDNLIPLCERHHKLIHKKKKFTYSTEIDYEPSRFHKNLSVLQWAIRNLKKVYFSYEKFTGERSKRTIKPERIVAMGGSRCVEGFCFLRNAERVFNIKRIKNLKITDDIIGSYDY